MTDQRVDNHDAKWENHEHEHAFTVRGFVKHDVSKKKEKPSHKPRSGYCELKRYDGVKTRHRCDHHPKHHQTDDDRYRVSHESFVNRPSF